MTDIASRFLLANLAAAFAVVLVLLIRKPARRLFGARLAYMLWLLVPLASIASLIPRVVEVVMPAAPPQDALTLPPAPNFDAVPAAPITLEDAGAAPVSQLTAIDPWILGWLAWLAGAVAMAMWFAYGQSRFLADARKGRAGPAVVGVLRPRIIVPADFEDRFEPKERDVILAHEKIHLSRYDAHINGLVAVVRCLCWFNPLIHLAAYLARIDQELACDATVAERHPKAKAVYASALLKAQLAARPLPLGCYWPAGTEHPLTERIEMLKQAAPGRARRIVGAGVLAVLAVGAGLSAWAAMPPETRLVEAPQDQLPPAPAPQKPVDFSALPGFNADERLEITGEIVRTASDDRDSDFWIQASEIRRNGGPAEPNAQLWRIDLSALRAGVERIVAGEELGYAPPKNTTRIGKHVRVSAYAASEPACNPDCRAQAVMILMAPKSAQDAAPARSPPQKQAASPSRDASLPSPFDNVHLVILQGRITKIELGTSESYIWVETRNVGRPDQTPKATKQLWRVKASAEPNAPNWVRDPKTIGMAVEVRGYSGEETACDPNCTMNGTAIRQLSGYPMPGITFGSGFWLPPGPPLPEPPKPTAQPILYEPQQPSPVPPSAPPSPQVAPQPIQYQQQPPSMQQSLPLPITGDFVSNSAIKLEIDTRIRLRGKVERVDFRDTSYVVFVRATGISRDFGDPGPGRPAFPRAYQPNTELWELSPTNYFGDRDAIKADLMGKNVELRGLNVNNSCSPSCKVKLTELIMPQSTAVPPPAADASLVTQFGQWYDTTALSYVRGKVERVEFYERTFDVYIRPEARGAAPSPLVQARSEYRFPRADVERALLNKTVTATGWRAREGLSTFCDPVCGLYATNFELPTGARISPAGQALVSEPMPDAPAAFREAFDWNAPMTIEGKILKVEADGAISGPNDRNLANVVWVETSSVEPASTPGAKPGTIWRVVGGGLPLPADQWIGHPVTARGYNAKDKTCTPTCSMSHGSMSVR